MPAVATTAADEPDEDSQSSQQNVTANVAMLGAGNMGGAMMRGWIESGVASVDRLAACVRAEENVIAWDREGVQARAPAWLCAACAQRLVTLCVCSS
jgi:pyrroline-5-carboxylate reductase